MTNTIRLLLLVLLFFPLTIFSQTCQSPITATLSGITCNDNGTPLDSLDDTYVFLLSVTGDSTSWSIEQDSVLYPYDSTFSFGPIPISGGPLTLVLLNNSDSLCTDTVLVTPPSPCSMPAPTCQTPISASFAGIACDDNGTPLDSLDDTYTLDLTVTGDSTSWSLAGDTLMFPYDTATNVGPFLISAGVATLIVLNNADSLCTDTVSITPPAPCSVAPTCQTPISASFAGIACDDNGTPLDSLDDTYTLDLTVTGDSTSWSIAGDTLMFPYDTATNVGPFLISAGVATLIVLNNADSLCMDTVTVTPPPPCSVPLMACDVKEIGCMKYELLQVMLDSMNRKTYTIVVTNNCPNKMIYTAFQLPKGLVAKAPNDNDTYIAPSGREYLVRNPNFSPFYSIRFKSTTDSISGGQSDIFEYTLQPQANPDYIHVVTRVAPKIFYEAHLNTFKCRDSLPQMAVAPSTSINGPKTGPTTVTPGSPGPPTTPGATTAFNIYPNPTTGGQVTLDLTSWKGQQVEIQFFNAKGGLLKTLKVPTADQTQLFDLPAGLDAGLYWIKLIPAGGLPEVQQLVIQW